MQCCQSTIKITYGLSNEVKSMNQDFEGLLSSGLAIFVGVHKKSLPFVISFDVVVRAGGSNTKNAAQKRSVSKWNAERSLSLTYRDLSLYKRAVSSSPHLQWWARAGWPPALRARCVPTASCCPTWATWGSTCSTSEEDWSGCVVWTAAAVAAAAATTQMAENSSSSPNCLWPTALPCHMQIHTCKINQRVEEKNAMIGWIRMNNVEKKVFERGY